MTEDGIEICFSDVHRQNANLPIDFIVCGIIICVICVQLSNVFGSISSPSFDNKRLTILI